MSRTMFGLLKCLAPDDGGSGGSGDDKPMSRQEVTDLINNTVTGATKQWGARFKKDVMSDFQKTLEESLKPLSAKLEERVTDGGHQSASVSSNASQGGAASGLSEDAQRALAKAQEEARKATESVANMQKALAKKDEELAQRTLDGELAEALSKAEIRPELREAAMLIHKASGNVALKDGRVILKIKKENYEDELPIREGIAEWAKTDSAKPYLAPVDAGGSGDTSRVRGSGIRNGAGEGLLSKNPVDRTMAAFEILGGGAD